MKIGLGGLLSGLGLSVLGTGTGAFLGERSGAGRLWTMGCEPGLDLFGRPCDLPRLCREHVSVVVVCPLVLPFDQRVEEDEVRAVGRSIGLDVHLDFCEVAIVENGVVRSAGRVETTPERLELFARSLGPEDRVALEVTGNAWEIARILEPHVKRVIVVSPDDTGIRQARAKTDRLDARTLARLLAAGELEAVWVTDERMRVMRRRLARREQLVRSRSRAKNEIHAVLMRRLKGRLPVADLFGVKGRRWLSELELPLEEAETIDSALRHIEFLDQEIAAVERLIARDALQSPQLRRLMTVPGDLAEYGLPVPEEGIFARMNRLGVVPAVVDMEVIEAIKAGRIEVVRGVESLSPTAVELADGARVEPDAIVCATGYRSGMGPSSATSTCSTSAACRGRSAPSRRPATR
jgi:Transposase